MIIDFCGPLSQAWNELLPMLDFVLKMFVIILQVGFHVEAPHIQDNPDVVAEPEVEHPLLEAAKAAGAQKREEISLLLTPE